MRTSRENRQPIGTSNSLFSFHEMLESLGKKDKENISAKFNNTYIQKCISSGYNSICSHCIAPVILLDLQEDYAVGGCKCQLSGKSLSICQLSVKFWAIVSYQ